MVSAIVFGFRHSVIFQNITDVSKETAVSVFNVDMMYEFLFYRNCLSTFRRTGLFSSNHPPWRHTNRA